MICHLHTTYYAERHRERRAELDLCLRMNAQAFGLMHVLSEGVSVRAIDAVWEVTDQRQTYTHLIERANKLADDDDISVLANCDIIIPRDSVHQMAANIGANEVYCLARHEIDTGGLTKLYDVNCSQDVWAWRGKLRITHDDFFGVPGCENRFAFKLRAAGYRVLNPSRSVVTIHVHNSRIRTRTNSISHRLPAPYLFLSPHLLGEVPEYREIVGAKDFHDELVRSRQIRRSARRDAETLQQLQESH